jgi:enolase
LYLRLLFGVFIGRIKRVLGRQILDSRGNPTVQADIYTTHGFGRASCPSGASTGSHEAIELRDGGRKFSGKGVCRAVGNINGRIARALAGLDVSDQESIDECLLCLDGTENKGRLGANATTAVSLAAATCAANEKGMGLYRLLGGNKLPSPMLNVLNGGKHALNGVSIQEFMVFPLYFSSFSDALCAGTEIYHSLRGIIAKKYGGEATGVGDEGGFAPPCRSTEDALGLLERAIGECGYQKKVRLAIDAAASSFYDAKCSQYSVDGRRIGAGELSDFYASLAKSHPIISLEDPFHEEAFGDFSELRKRLSGKVQLVADDLTVTNSSRLKTAMRGKSLSALLLKVNQVGTLTEAIGAARLCKREKLGVIVSHRSGETEDASIADIAVGLNCGQIKAGAPCRAERTSKYNRLLQIEGELPIRSFARDSGIVL